MCYPCLQCGKCGKYKKESAFYTPPAAIPCFRCGGEVDGATGVCTTCGHRAFSPAGQRDEARPSRESEVRERADIL